MSRTKTPAPRPAGIDNEYLAIANTTGSRGFHEAFDDFGGPLVADPNADLDFWQKRHAVFAAQVTIQIAFLPAVALGFLNHAGNDVQVVDGI